MRGRVEVIEKSSWSGDVSVSVGGQPANIDIQSTDSAANARKRRDIYKSKQ